jgi:rSAM/selenodomain-associated transferase 2
MNAGAAAATGDTLLFLHADTRLPDGFEQQVTRLLAEPGVSAGAFELRIEAERWSLRIIERVVRWRSRALHMPYGDQALFMTREIFQRAGGFPPLPAMEDFELVRRLRRLGRVEIAPAAVSTSPRRWITRGSWRTTLLNQLCILAHTLGVSPDRIARWRRPRGRVSEPRAEPRRAPHSDDLVETAPPPQRTEQGA